MENIFRSLNLIEKIEFVPSAIKEFHPYQKADILLAENLVSTSSEKKIGFLGQIHPQLTKKYQIAPSVFGVQIFLSKLFAFLTKNNQWYYQPVSIFPKIEQDLSFVLEQNIEAEKVIKTIKNAGGSLLTKVEVYDIYQNKEYSEKGQKSITFRLTFQSPEKTLLNKEVNEIVKKIVAQAQSSLGAKLRISKNL